MPKPRRTTTATASAGATILWRRVERLLRLANKIARRTLQPQAGRYRYLPPSSDGAMKRNGNTGSAAARTHSINRTVRQ